jgi:RNA polymerase sigma-70 factor (ECF subfamily)
MFRKLSSKGKTDISIDDEGVREIASDERVDQLTEAAETANALLNAVKSLGQPDSTIIIQKYYYNKSSGEIAGAVSMKPAAVRQRISRALKRLNEILAAAGEGR